MLDALATKYSLYVITGLIIGIALIFAIFTRKKHRLPLPPVSAGDAYGNFKSLIGQKGLSRYNYILSESLIMAKKYGGKFGAVYQQKQLPVLGKETFYVTDWQMARTILLGDRKNDVAESIKKTPLRAFNFVDRNVSNLFTSPSLAPGREAARKFIAPSFSSTSLQYTVACLNENMKKLYKTLDSHCEIGSQVDMKELCLAIVIDTLTKSSFDVEFMNGSDYSGNPSSEPCTYAGSIDGKKFLDELEISLKERALQSFISLRRLMFWDPAVGRADEACAYMGKEAQNIIDMYRKKHRSHPKEEKETSKSGTAHHILGRIIDHDFKNDAERISQVLIFIMAGHETTAFSLCFTLYELGKNPIMRAKLQKELDRSYEQSHNQAEWPSSNEASGLQYLNHCIKEAMRLWPVAGAGSGRSVPQDLEYNGTVIPKGSNAQTYFYAMFRQEWISQPNEFMPERWEDANPQSKDLKDMLMPFSLGKRGCIGQNMAILELRLITANLLRKYDFHLPQEIEFEIFLTLKPKSLFMDVVQRGV